MINTPLDVYFLVLSLCAFAAMLGFLMGVEMMENKYKDELDKWETVFGDDEEDERGTF